MLLINLELVGQLYDIKIDLSLNKKYVLGSTAKTTDLKRSFLFATCLSIFMYLVTSYLLYKYTHNKILILGIYSQSPFLNIKLSLSPTNI